MKLSQINIKFPILTPEASKARKNQLNTYHATTQTQHGKRKYHPTIIHQPLLRTPNASYEEAEKRNERAAPKLPATAKRKENHHPLHHFPNQIMEPLTCGILERLSIIVRADDADHQICVDLMKAWSWS
jgi:hypothetical protein